MQLSLPPKLYRVVRTVWMYVVIPGLVVSAALVLLSFTVLPPALLLVTACFLLVAYLARAQSSQTTTSVHMSPQAEQLVATKAQLEHLFEHSPVPYLRIDRTGQILQGNLAAVRLFATTQDQIEQISLFSQLVTADETSTSVILGKLESGVSVSDLELIIRTTADSERWVRLSIYVAGINAAECLVTLVDITQQKRIDQAKSEFVALAAHQLRTPIAAIRWNIELFMNNQSLVLEEKMQGYITKVSRNAVRMVTLINDFLSVSKLETGTFEADPETVDFTNYLNEILEEFTSTIQQKKLAVQLQTPPTAVTVQADGRLLHIVTSNLISNATKYTPNEGTVYVSYEVQDPYVVFSVRDSGIGIPLHEQVHLFTKFYRASNARQHRAEGTGLGLYIVKQSAEIMGGDIAMQSVENEGSTFTVRFPVSATTPASERTPQ